MIASRWQSSVNWIFASRKRSMKVSNCSMLFMVQA